MIKVKRKIFVLLGFIIYNCNAEYIKVPFPRKNNFEDVILEDIDNTQKQSTCESLCDQKRLKNEQVKKCEAYAFSALSHRCLLLSDVPYAIPNKDPKMTVYSLKKDMSKSQTLVGDTYVQLITKRLDVEEAQKYCQKLGGTIAAVKDAQANDILSKMMEERNIWKAFINIHGDSEKRSWLHFDGRKLSFMNWDEKETWKRKGRNCAVLNLTPTQTWTPTNCKYPNYFFCEFPIV